MSHADMVPVRDVRVPRALPKCLALDLTSNWGVLTCPCLVMAVVPAAEPAPTPGISVQRPWDGTSDMARHAYLLIVHELPDQVQQLVDLLDDPRNDIYVMADATGEIDPTRLTTSRSRIIALPRIPLHWAGYSMLEAMLRMLEAATPAGPYAY